MWFCLFLCFKSAVLNGVNVLPPVFQDGGLVFVLCLLSVELMWFSGGPVLLTCVNGYKQASSF